MKIYQEIENKIKISMPYVEKKKVKILILIVVSTIIIFGAKYLSGVARDSNQAMTATVISEDNKKVAIEDLVAVVGKGDAIGNKDIGSSWPGEIISSQISQIQPQRQGVITEWRVNVGDLVSKGDILGKISAPPATPELIKMLAEQTESLARAKAQAVVADEFSVKEIARLDALKSALSNTGTSTDFSFTALVGMREKVKIKLDALRSFVEQTIARHVATVSNISDFKFFKYGSLNRNYGFLNQDIQNKYESKLIDLVEKLKNQTNVPIKDAQDYFSLAVRLANSSGNDVEMAEFKTITVVDQKDFLDLISDYREAENELADKETEYKIMISEKGAMVEKDRSMAHAEAVAAEASYNTVSKEINGGSYIISPRSGSVSAIYKKVGDLVLPEMSVAIIAGQNDAGLIVRMRIPGNIRKPVKGDVFSVMRPGFPNDIHQVKLIGVGTSLDETGSYMADAILVEKVDWPALASVRVIAPSSENTPIIKFSSIWWSKGGLPHIWAISEAGRVFAKKITIGRTIGMTVEVYDGLKNGDRYISNPTSEISENMFIEDFVKISEPKNNSKNVPAKSGGHNEMPGMEM